MDKQLFEEEQIKTSSEGEIKTRIKPIQKWKDRTSASKAGTITAICIFGVIFIGLILLAFCRQIFGNEVGDAILGKDVSNGFQYMWNGIVSKKNALFGTVVTIFIAFILKFIIDLIVNLTARKTKKAKTIGSLIKSLFKYVIVIITIGIILSLWGVNVAGIIAGVGIITLIVGLGCQSLVNDFVSGIFIVTDCYFEVGDTVIIDGFRGTVVSVGLRTTKLRDWCNNIKSISNSQITSVVNVSRYSSNAIVYFVIPFNQDLRKVEALINENLSQIEKNMPFLMGKIVYKGITEVTEKGAKMYFTAPCKEEHKFQTERDLLRQIYLLLSENNIGYPFQPIQFNKDAEIKHEKATEAEIKSSDKLLEETHKVDSKKTTSKKIVKEMVESLVVERDRDDEEQ